MKKLKLEIESLSVETFAAQDRAPAGAGTVRGQQFTDAVTCRESCGCPVTDLAHTCTCPDTSNYNPCFCTEWQTCWDCADA
ncbi:MAG: hypothetical protein ACJ8GN_15895 [Longimicrobiaceae bacterium]